MKAQLVEIKTVVEGIKSFVFEPERPVKWRPGYYWKLTLPHPHTDDRGVERWFTISAAPFEGRPAITTRLDAEPLSSFKQALRSLKVGDELEVEAPEGDFVLEDLDGKYVFLAGGIGITPFRSMLAQFGHEGTMPQIHLIHGVRNLDAPFKDELEALSRSHPNLSVTYLVEPQRLSAETIKRHVSNLAEVTFYVSGPEPMVEALDAELASLKIPDSHIKNDFFPGYTKI